MNRTLCKEDNTVLNQKRDEEQFSGLTLIPSELGRLWEGISVECCKTKTKGKSKEYNQEEEQNRLSALSVRKRKWPRLRLDLVFNVADLKYGVCFSSTPIILRSKAKPKQSSIQLEITLLCDIVFTLPDVEVTIQKYP